MVTRLGGVVVGGALVAGIGALALSSYLYRHRDSPGVYWFIASLLAVSGWCCTYGVALLVGSFPLRAHLTTLWLSFAIWTGPLFLLFGLAYTGRDATPLSAPTLATLSVPAVGTLLLATYRFHSLLWTELVLSPVAGLAAVRLALQPLAYILIGYALVSTAVGVLLLVETITSYGPLYRGEAVAVALSTVPPAAGAVLWLLDWGPMAPLNLAPTAFVAHLALDSYAFVGRNMFETNPTTRRAAERSMVDDIGTPVFALDPADRVVTVNDAAVDLVGRDQADLLGEPLTAFLGIDSTAALDQETLTATTDGRQRQFTVVTAPLTDPADTNVGRTVILQEVTQEREREQRLDVLNRVIRHNLRNEMTVILGHADRILDRTDDDAVTGCADTIIDSAERLLATGEKARQFEQLRATSADSTTVDTAEFIDGVVADLRTAFPRATVEVEMADDQREVTTDPGILALVVSSLLENALAHNDTDCPRAVVTLSAASEGLEIRISDNGPGIDPAELAPIRRGGETELDHSTGIGLWVATWGASMLGGEIEFNTTDEGTDVVLSVPTPSETTQSKTPP